MACRTCGKIVNVINKAGQIADAYINLVVTDPVVEDLARQRITICNPCPNKTPLIQVGNNVFYKCNMCGCPLEALIRCPECHCDAGKW